MKKVSKGLIEAIIFSAGSTWVGTTLFLPQNKAAIIRFLGNGEPMQCQALETLDLISQGWQRIGSLSGTAEVHWRL